MILCDKLIQKGGEFKETLAPVIDLLGLMGTSTIGINQLRRDIVKHKLPANLKSLGKNVPPGSNLLFGKEINKIICQLYATNSALQRPNNQGYSSYNK